MALEPRLTPSDPSGDATITACTDRINTGRCLPLHEHCHKQEAMVLGAWLVSYSPSRGAAPPEILHTSRNDPA